MTSYLITKQQNGYLLQCISGPCKLGLERIETDDPSIEDDLRQLGIPQDRRAAVLEEVRSKGTGTVTFDAKPMEPLTSVS